MARKKAREPFAQVVQEVRDERPQQVSVPTAWTKDRALIDPTGEQWKLLREELDRRIVDRLIKRGDVPEVIDRVGGRYQEWLSPQEAHERWESRLRDRYDGPSGEVKGPPWPSSRRTRPTRWLGRKDAAFSVSSRTADSLLVPALL